MRSSLVSRVLLVQLVALLLVGLAVGSPARLLKRLNSNELSLCDTDEFISDVCYQCSTAHAADFLMVYKFCCSPERNEMRTYCSGIYTKPPKRGGLWLS
ncbi:sodium-influx-stimulating peptide [Aplysia californica]|uniref:Sodium-influx-stimulating peptide n=1 Tax=Aplysia californica TaxID=6500 RepID=A0ABM1A2V8_APLCA|nr:sodium-influx-stimulating peptide [Aplysia californica]